MLKSVLTMAVLTGAFRAVFALGMDLLTDMLERGQVVVVSFASGFMGSLVAQGVRHFTGKGR